MAKKKGHIGQKKVQGPKAKALQKAKKQKKAVLKAKSKARKTQSKAVTTNLKKISFDNSKKIDLLNADITKILTVPPKAATSSQDSKSQKRPIPVDIEVPDVGGIEQKMEQM